MISVALTIWGLFILVQNKVRLTATKVVSGTPALAVAGLLLSIYPLNLLSRWLLASIGNNFERTAIGHSAVIETALAILIVGTALSISMRYATNPEEVVDPETTKRTTKRPTSNSEDEHNPYAAPES